MFQSCKLRIVEFIVFVVVLLQPKSRLVVSISGHDAFDFRHRDHWQEPAEQQEQGREQAEATNEHPDVHPSRGEVGPT